MIVVIVGAIVTISLCTFFVVSSSERLHGMKTNAKSFSPTWQPSQTPNTNATNENSSNKSDDLTIILAGVGGGAIFSVGCIYAIIALRQKLQHAKVKIEEIGKEIEGVVESATGYAKIDWKDVSVEEELGKQAVLGFGTYGVAVQCVLKGKGAIVVKVLSKSGWSTEGHCGMSFIQSCEHAIKDATIAVKFNKKIPDKNVLHVHGIAVGMLPGNLSQFFLCPMGHPCVGIVMDYASGGNLYEYLYRTAYDKKENDGLTLKDRLKMMQVVVRLIADLHYHGISHGNIKPENFLLSDEDPPSVRVHDYGFSPIHSIVDKYVTLSAYQMRQCVRYAAPELLHNFFEDEDGDANENGLLDGNGVKLDLAADEEGDDVMPQCSWRTDMFSCGILFHEILTSIPPFREVLSVSELARLICRGGRPPFTQNMQHTLPLGVQDMVEACWAEDPALRPSAAECVARLQFILKRIVFTLRGNAIPEPYDIYISHAWDHKIILSNIFNKLTAAHYNVWYDQDERRYDAVTTWTSGVGNSGLKIVCLSRKYQQTEACMNELRKICKFGSAQLLVFTMEENAATWATEELKALTKVETWKKFDFSAAAAGGWASTTGPTTMALTRLSMVMSSVLKLLPNIGVQPTLKDFSLKKREKVKKVRHQKSVASMPIDSAAILKTIRASRANSPTKK